MPKILLVEDNEMNRDMLSRRLIRRGFEVAIAVDGREGVEQASTGAYDLGSNYDAYFWWEATAEWASAVVYPQSPANYAFDYAKQKGGLDFMALSPHCREHVENDTEANMTREGYAQLREVAAERSDDAFLGIASMEWSTNSTGNHVNILGSSELTKMQRGRFDELYGDSAGHVQDSIFYVTSEAAVVSFNLTLGPFTSTDREPFEAGFEAAIKEKASRVYSCSPVKTDGDTWNCFEWYHTVDGESLRNVSYLSGRGITKVVVTFTAHEDSFGKFGSTSRWLTEYVEWKGPSAFYAL